MTEHFHTTILRFPEPRNFFEWLKKRGIHEYGQVILDERKVGTHGVPFITCSIRLSARDLSRDEILQCEIPFYHEIYMGEEHSRKEAEEKEKVMKDYIHKVHEESFKGYEVTVIPAEFKAGED